MRTFKALLLATLTLALAACGSTKYTGKIIPGNVGRPLIVESNDDRLNNEQGIPNLTVTLYAESKTGRPPLQIDRTISDEEGLFAFSIKNADTPRSAVIVRVTGDDIYSARSKTYLPRSGQTMLFTVVTKQPIEDSPE